MGLFNADTLSFADQGVSESATAGVTEDGGAAVAGGRLLGVRATITDNTAGAADTVTVKVYKDDETDVASGGEELYSADFAFDSDEATLSDLLASPIPFFGQPFVTITPAAEDGTDMSITLYIDDGR